MSRLAASDAASLNLTPLIDVVLLLLLFFMLTSPMILRAALPPIAPPETTRPRAVAEGADRLVLDADDTLTLNGAPVEPEALGGRLEALRGRRLNVLADAKASLGLTVRVLDACKAAGVEAQIYARPAEP